MKTSRRVVAGMLVLLTTGVSLTPSLAQPPAQTPAEAPLPIEWPREMASADGTRWTVYQPQINSWEEQERFDGWVAVTITRPREPEPVVGALHITAETETNLETRIVVVHELQVVEGRFPALDESRTARMVEGAQSLVAEVTRELSLDRVLAYFERMESRPPEIELSTEPPTIFVRTTPAVLLLLDGDPLMSPIADELDLRFAVNTNWDLFRQGDGGLWYLRDEDAWLAAEDFRGPWQAAGQLPDGFAQLPETENWTDVRDSVPPAPIDGTLPEVVVSTVPAELILMEGEPRFTRIPSTQISFVANTDADLYAHSGDGNYYYLVSGRWFRAGTLEGPWVFASRELPTDFADIPPDHERGEILYSVPGTPQAQEALILSQIPETAVVQRSEATVDVSYAGEPQFEPIEGTGLSYAVNTAFDVIKVADDAYYVNFEGVWFVGPSATGPWQVADSIPAEIYSIPATSPVHNTTYCEVKESSDTTVTFAITAGYWGVYWGYGSVYFGVGWYWPPYYYWGGGYPYYYWRPYSYGVGAWYNPYTGRYGRSAVAYGPYGGYGRSAAYNPRTGTYTRGAAAWGMGGGAMVGEAYNPRTGTYASTRQSVSPYARWGASTVQRGDDWARTFSAAGESGTLRGFETSGGRGGMVARGEDNTYVGKDGNVYRRNEGGGWSRYDNGGWNPVEGGQRAGAEQRAGVQDRAAAGARGGGQPRAGTFDNRTGSADVMNRLNQDARARSQASVRSRQARNYRSSGAGMRPRGGIRRR
jgi:hypothetical protein